MDTMIITVGRQLGSGGRAIGKLIADKLGYAFYDKEILNMAAKESGFSEKFFEQNDENRGFMRSLFHMHMPHLSDDNFYDNRFSPAGLFKFQSDAITHAASDGGCVFVGRCADYILRDHANLVNIFISAPVSWRVEHVMKRHDCSYQEAIKIIDKAESARASYYNYYTGKRWGDSASYDLCIDSSILGIEETAEFICNFVHKVQSTEMKFNGNVNGNG
ncbi:MAG: cytidylate kinase-like family protein [Prevotella sp.]|nr:cytidylate kinase-like family protein [Prevotella sp.]